MQKTVLGFVVAGVVLGGGWYALSMSKSSEVNMTAEKAAMEREEMEKAAMEEKIEMEEKAQMDKAEMEKVEMKEKEDGTMDEKDEMMKDEDQAMSQGEILMAKAGVYAPYEAGKLTMAATGDVVLFFKASWCPSCRTVDADIKANLESIPEKLTILEVDYDNSVELKKKYGVTTQHTFVQVDQTGTLIKKWSGGSTLASVVAQVQ